MKLVKNGDITLTIDSNGAPIFLKPVRCQQTVLCIKHHKFSDLQIFKALLTNFFWLLLSPKHIVMVINSPIKIKVYFITKPNVIEPAGSFL